MSEQSKIINREQLHTELWRTPLSKLAKDWGVPIANIIKAAETLNVPRPEASLRFFLMKSGRRNLAV